MTPFFFSGTEQMQIILIKKKMRKFNRFNFLHYRVFRVFSYGTKFFLNPVFFITFKVMKKMYSFLNHFVKDVRQVIKKKDLKNANHPSFLPPQKKSGSMFLRSKKTSGSMFLRSKKNLDPCFCGGFLFLKSTDHLFFFRSLNAKNDEKKTGTEQKGGL